MSRRERKHSDDEEEYRYSSRRSKRRRDKDEYDDDDDYRESSRHSRRRSGKSSRRSRERSSRRHRSRDSEHRSSRRKQRSSSSRSRRRRRRDSPSPSYRHGSRRSKDYKSPSPPSEDYSVSSLSPPPRSSVSPHHQTITPISLSFNSVAAKPKPTQPQPSPENALKVPDLSYHQASEAQQKDREARLRAWRQTYVESQGIVEEIADGKSHETDNEEDPLDQFMSNLAETRTSEIPTVKPQIMYKDSVYTEEDLQQLVSQQDQTPSWIRQHKQLKKKEIKPIDHSLQNYLPVRKNLYREAPEIAQMTQDQVNALRKNQLQGVKIRGTNCPNPILRWTHCGLPSSLYKVLEQHYPQPFPVQAQAIPVIMSGRDCLACAKTGSGKTLAFLLPALRHIQDQPPLSSGQGPIGLVLAPTRELAIQIAAESKRLCKPLGISTVCCYGGTGVSEQISALRKGAELVIATPGRMIDMLCANSGRVTNLQRCTYLVLDEADRMFDMGFGPQISAILQNARPDRQTVMFSATLPRQIEGLARQALQNPVEIMVGGRSVASDTIEQFVEVLEPKERFPRLIELLSEWYDKGSVLVFVDRQEAVDFLYAELVRSGYPCLALHGGMDQSDRDYTILDFKRGVRTLMVATSVAARGLDVAELVLVINYSPAHHYEDYVHRIGRTGRAGNKGTAISFIGWEEERFAPELVKALKRSKAQIPAALQEISDAFEEKRSSGEVKFGANDGYIGKGFRFDEKEAQKVIDDQNRVKRSLGMMDEDEEMDMPLFGIGGDEDMDVDVSRGEENGKVEQVSVSEQLAKAKQLVSAAKEAFKAPDPLSLSSGQAITYSAMEHARKLGELASMKQEISGSVGTVDFPILDEQELSSEYYCEEVEINDYPQEARWKVTHKDSLADIQEWTDVAITTRGSYIAPGRNAPPGERKLYLAIEGKSKTTVLNARKEITRVLEEAAATAQPDTNSYGKYSVV